MKVRVNTVLDQNGQPAGEISYWMWCPGCDDAVRIDNTWQFNGDIEKPTFEPSILTTSPSRRCHSFLRDGMWQFLSDCDHALAGQTVPMVVLPEWLARES